VLVELERYDEALEMFGRCLRLDPHDASARYEMAYIKFRQGRHSEALDELDAPTRTAHDEWEAHNLRGICLLGLGRYDEALAAFGHALLLTDDMHTQVTLLERVIAVERHREFRRLRSMKDQLYAEDGVVCLGSAQDDGLVVNEAHDYHFTYPDIGTTLQRLLGLMRSGQAQLTAVAPLDGMAQPLAHALCAALGLELRGFNDLRPDDKALLVLGVAREAELLSLAVERVPCPAVCFCLGLNWLRHSRLLPDIAGMVVHGSCSVPWEPELRRLRSSGASPSVIAAYLADASARVGAAVRDTPPDANLARQIRYYTRLHRRLSFPL
jgi:tetratricopeptide (TPR) repeat protein